MWKWSWKSMSKLLRRKGNGVLSISVFEKEGKRPNIVVQKARFIRSENRWAKRGDLGFEELHLFEEQLPKLATLLSEAVSESSGV